MASLDLCLISRIVHDGGLRRVKESGLSAELLKDDGRVAFEYIVEHVAKYGKIPEAGTIMGVTGVAIPPLSEVLEPIDFYIDHIKRRRMQDLADAHTRAAISAAEKADFQTVVVSARALVEDVERISDPVIDVTDCDVARVVEAAERLLLMSAAQIWQRAGLLVRVIRAASPSRGVAREAGAATIAAVTAANLREELSRCARWICMGRHGYVAVVPPSWAIDALLERGDWDFPVLDGVVVMPPLRRDASVCWRPGYDRKTRLLFEPCGARFPRIPAAPTPEEARRALDALMEPFCDFPFVSAIDRAAVLAAILTALVRHLIDGPIPAYLVRAPVRGSGKTRLVDVIAIIVTGVAAARYVHAEDETEQRKSLLAICLAGDAVVLIDNVERPLQSAVLAAALTAREVRDRLLGASRMITAPMNGIWFVTGNNVSVRGDLSRRIVVIDLDPSTEFPEERTGFRFPDLLSWVREHRPRLVAAALTILRAWWVAGRPQPNVAPWGSYEAWSGIVRACVMWLGEPDPIGARDRLRQEGDLEGDDVREAISAWSEAFPGGLPRTISQVIAWIEERDETGSALEARRLRDALGGLYPGYDGRRLNPHRLGHALRKYRGRLFDGQSIESGDRTNEGIPWRVVDHSARVDRAERVDGDDPGNRHGDGGSDRDPEPDDPEGRGQDHRHDHHDRHHGSPSAGENL